MNFKSICIFLITVFTTTALQAIQTEAENELSKQLTFAVSEVNAKTPMTLDEETRLDSAATTANYIIYTNTMINYTAAQLDSAQFTQIIQASVIDTLCANKALEGFINLGVIMVYRYLGKDGHFITELSLDMSSCKNS